ncbi:1-acyl-sn-glycerol-3-phosphate acyltransferase [Deinococcus reticulitermitis]|uniref:1-acyl-sn-glycerol-3-phosphate acyltransferase n=1 Tax=Deinococcus reticulitermitis TaxID=856736 RepID=A0A1H6ZI34_9DEIO|nr:lysophospholipid acyltransferase family protein [Deinococcus reticulitermitis]SEJ49220.1 1-acyl-sn-glycerol-3-phosphate acyltransferase [Deinococcus reticulitermitis]
MSGAPPPDEQRPDEQRLHFPGLRTAFFLGVVRPLLLLGFGVGVRHRERLPARGPALVVANHNSHLDTLLLLSLFSSRTLPLVRPVAAGDYFGRSRALRWLTREIVGGLLIDRAPSGGRRDPLAPVMAALGRGEIVLLFPEGTRGEPEVRAEFKSGVAHLARRRPDVPVVPVGLRGLGYALPKGEWLPVPLNLYVAVGEALTPGADRRAFMAQLEAAMEALDAELPRLHWD